MWSVIVAFRPAPPSRYRYNLSRACVGIVGKYCLVALSKWVRRRFNCDVTMVVANGLRSLADWAAPDFRPIRQQNSSQMYM